MTSAKQLTVTSSYSFGDVRVLGSYTPMQYGDTFTLNGPNSSANFCLYMDGCHFIQNSIKAGIMVEVIDKSMPMNVSIEFWLEGEEDDEYIETEDGEEVCPEPAKKFDPFTCEFTFEHPAQRCEFELAGYEEYDFVTDKMSDEGSVLCCCKITFLSYAETAPTLGQKLWKAFEDGSQFDTTILADEKEFKVSGCILTVHSPVFSQMLTSPNYQEAQSKVIKIEQFSAALIRDFIQWMYTEKVGVINTKNADGLYVLADKYMVDELKFRCADAIYAKLCDDNITSSLILSKMFNDALLEGRISAFIKKKGAEFGEKVFASEMWQQYLKGEYDVYKQI